MDMTMQESADALRERLGYVWVNDGPTRLWAKMTDDFGGCILPDLPREDLEKLTENRHGKVNLCVSDTLGVRFTLVVGRFREFGWVSSGVGGGVLCAMQGAALRREDFDALRVRNVNVSTDIAGVVPRIFVDADGNSIGLSAVVDKWLAGEPVAIKRPRDAIEHGAWRCGVGWTISDNGVSATGTMATLPVTDDSPVAAIELAVKRSKAYLVLLTLLNGGHRVSLQKVVLDAEGYKGGIPLLFPMESHDLLPLGFTEGNTGITLHKNQLKTYWGLEEIGMEGVKKWVEWMTHPDNVHIVRQWQQPDVEANPMLTVEGLARAFGATRNTNYSAKLIFVCRKIGVDELFNGDEGQEALKAINKAHNHYKHIGRLRGTNYFEAEEMVGRLRVFMSFVVAFGFLVAAGIGKESKNPSGIRNTWRSMIRRTYANHIEKDLLAFGGAKR